MFGFTINGGILQKRGLAANADFCGLEITVQHLSVRFLTLLFSQHSLSGAHTIFRHLFQFSFQAMLSIFSQVCSIPRLFILQEKFMIKSSARKLLKHKYKKFPDSSYELSGFLLS